MLGRDRKSQQAETRSGRRVGKEGAWVAGKWAGRKVSDRNPGPCWGLLEGEKRAAWTGRLFLSGFLFVRRGWMARPGLVLFERKNQRERGEREERKTPGRGKNKSGLARDSGVVLGCHSTIRIWAEAALMQSPRWGRPCDFWLFDFADSSLGQEG